MVVRMKSHTESILEPTSDGLKIPHPPRPGGLSSFRLGTPIVYNEIVVLPTKMGK